VYVKNVGGSGLLRSESLKGVRYLRKRLPVFPFRDALDIAAHALGVM
jgi:hypothetical protein